MSRRVPPGARGARARGQSPARGASPSRGGPGSARGGSTSRGSFRGGPPPRGGGPAAAPAAPGSTVTPAGELIGLLSPASENNKPFFEINSLADFYSVCVYVLCWLTCPHVGRATRWISRRSPRFVFCFSCLT